MDSSFFKEYANVELLTALNNTAPRPNESQALFLYFSILFADYVAAEFS